MMADKALRKRLQDEIKAFHQSRVTNSRPNLKKRSQMDLQKASFLEASKFSSQLFDVNTSITPEVAKNKKMVNFTT